MATKEKNDLPEILEFLKQARTMKRQLELFKELPMEEENKMVLKKAVKKLNVVLDNYLDYLEGE